ncbi:unnamed protein product [Moneuplotes crassus]|uniref:Uncharacterized protein n=1 Tax=Euplotes crassus TaxID=5936 RepID=A0AAD1UHB6_EUPCR|nr:unnamed protein product [Moneuplotes crassus]
MALPEGKLIRIQVYCRQKESPEFFQVRTDRGNIASLVKRICHRFGITGNTNYILKGSKGARFFTPSLFLQDDVVYLTERTPKFYTTQISDSEGEEKCEVYDRCKLCLIPHQRQHSQEPQIASEPAGDISDKVPVNKKPASQPPQKSEGQIKVLTPQVGKNVDVAPPAVKKKTTKERKKHVKERRKSFVNRVEPPKEGTTSPCFPQPTLIHGIEDTDIHNVKQNLTGHCSDSLPDHCAVCSLDSITKIEAKSSRRLKQGLVACINDRFKYRCKILEQKNPEEKRFVISCKEKSLKEGSSTSVECPWSICFFRKSKTSKYIFEQPLKNHHNHLLGHPTSVTPHLTPNKGRISRFGDSDNTNDDISDCKTPVKRKRIQKLIQKFQGQEESKINIASKERAVHEIPVNLKAQAVPNKKPNKMKRKKVKKPKKISQNCQESSATQNSKK